MPFWSSETIETRAHDEGLIRPFNKDHIEHCAYEFAIAHHFRTAAGTG